MNNVLNLVSYLPKRMLALPVLLAVLLLPGTVAANHASGSIPYTGSDTRGTDHAAFNIFSGDVPANPSDNGEQDFLTVSPAGQRAWVNQLTQCDGLADLHIYVHNGAETAANGENYDGDGVATGTRLKISLPSTPGEVQEIEATISADNTLTISDDAFIKCGEHDISLKYVAGSAKIFRSKTGNLDVLSDNVVGPNGTLIGSYEDDGVVPGCWEYRMYIVLTVEIEKVEKEEPIAECTSLSVVPTAVKPDQNVTFNAVAKAENGATITKYVFDFGDGQTSTVTTAAGTAQTTHSYDKVGTYNTKVTVHFDIAGTDQTDSGETCAKTVKVETEPPVTPPEEELPNTGPASVAAGFFGTGALFMGARSWLESRAMLRAGLLKRER